MAESSNDKLFRTKVLPIMDKVKQELYSRCADEIKSKQGSFAFFASGAAGPDGGMAAQRGQIDSLSLEKNKWNSKKVEDYIDMVKKELKKQNIHVDANMEKRMIEKMIKDQVPKSSIEYIMKKSASNSIFYLPKAISKSPLQEKIDARAEKAYDPSILEKGTGWALGAAADYATTGGMGGTWKAAAKFVGWDLGANAVLDAVDDTADIPLVIDPKHRQDYLDDQKKKTEQKPKEKPQKEDVVIEEQKQEVSSEQETKDDTLHTEEDTSKTNENGWGGLLSSLGLDGIGDVTHNLGYVLAMLPDMLVGLFTGKTKSLNLKDNLMPIASIVGGMFVRNPLLKMSLIGMGGANLLNKVGHEALNDHQQAGAVIGDRTIGHYKLYADEPLNARIQQPQISGNCLIATIDKVPCTIALSNKVVDAYTQGALPLNTLANAVLAKNDQMRQIASQNYEAGQQQNQERTLAQR